MQIFNWLFCFSLSWLSVPNSLELKSKCPSWESRRQFSFCWCICHGSRKWRGLRCCRIYETFSHQEYFYDDALDINAEFLRNEPTWKSQSVKIIQRKIIPIIEFSELEGRNDFSSNVFSFSFDFPCLCFIRKTVKIFYFIPGDFLVFFKCAHLSQFGQFDPPATPALWDVEFRWFRVQ